MHPILFRWRGRPVWSYPAMLHVGLSVGLVIGNLEANLRGLDGTRTYLATVLLVLPALAGARLVYVAGHWGLFRDDPARIWRHSVGGQAMYGGLFAVPVSIPLLRALGVPFWAFWDVATFTMLTGMVFTRVGCLLQGCCAGRVAARGHIPMQVLEAALGALVLGGVAAIPARAAPGTVFLAALAGYAAGRFVLQGAREARHRVAGVDVQRATSVFLASAAIAALVFSVTKL